MLQSRIEVGDYFDPRVSTKSGFIKSRHLDDVVALFGAIEYLKEPREFLV